MGGKIPPEIFVELVVVSPWPRHVASSFWKASMWRGDGWRSTWPRAFVFSWESARQNKTGMKGLGEKHAFGRIVWHDESKSEWWPHLRLQDDMTPQHDDMMLLKLGPGSEAFFFFFGNPYLEDVETWVESAGCNPPTNPSQVLKRCVGKPEGCSCLGKGFGICWNLIILVQKLAYPNGR